MDETLKSTLIETGTDMARKIRPDIHVGTKYGGTVFVTDPDAPESVGLAGGVYGYADHVSVVFAKGATFEDPNALLGGKGKMRRHVKLRGLNDLEDKEVAGFLAQAFA